MKLDTARKKEEEKTPNKHGPKENRKEENVGKQPVGSGDCNERRLWKLGCGNGENCKC